MTQLGVQTRESAGDRQPTPKELRTAIAAVEARYEPEQIILFGSAAHGTMNGNSDIDLLVITDEAGEELHIERVDTGTVLLDIVTVSAARAERNRGTAGRVEQAALEEGRIIQHRANEEPPVAVGKSFFTDKSQMTRITLSSAPWRISPKISLARKPCSSDVARASRSRSCRTRAAVEPVPLVAATRSNARSTSARVRPGAGAAGVERASRSAAKPTPTRPCRSEPQRNATPIWVRLFSVRVYLAHS